jgi:hypothetical protein
MLRAVKSEDGGEVTPFMRHGVSYLPECPVEEMACGLVARFANLMNCTFYDVFGDSNAQALAGIGQLGARVRFAEWRD